MVEVTLIEWKRRHARLMNRWPRETNPEVPAFLLRASFEPYSVLPVSLGVINRCGDLVGRFTYRLSGGSAFTGIYLHPNARNAGFAREAARLGLLHVRDQGAVTAWCSVAMPNRAAIWLNAHLGYKLDCVGDWRSLPEGFDLRLMWRWHTDHWRYLPEPAVLYKRMVLDLSGLGV